MKCPNCGAELTDDTVFCSYCGIKMSKNPRENTCNNNSYYYSPNGNYNNQGGHGVNQQPPRYNPTLQKKKGGFEKTAIIFIIIFLAFMFFSLVRGFKFAMVIAGLQAVMMILALLVKKTIIKIPEWISTLLMIISIVMVMLFVKVSGYEMDIEGAEKISWQSIVMSDKVPEPGSDYARIYQNSAEHLSINIYNIKKSEYSDYIIKCRDAGFNIDFNQYGNSFDACSESGYKISLYYSEGDKRLSINADIIDNQENNITSNIVETAEKTIEETTSNEIKVDYGNAESFESAINNGEKVNGKVVRFIVNNYEPESILGINCWAGEHLNFIFDNEIDVNVGDTIIGRVTEEANKLIVGSWEIKIELIKIEYTGLKDETVSEVETEQQTVPETEGYVTEAVTAEQQTEQITEAPIIETSNLSVENCPELAKILSKDSSYDDYESFAKQYRGRIIEFDGRVDYIVNHGNYKK